MPGVTLLALDRHDFIHAHVLGIEAFRVPSVSMSPTLEPGDVFVADRWAYREPAPAVGDIVVVLFAQTGTERYIKRIVGTPGDELEIRGGTVYRNSVALDECSVRPPVDQRSHGRDLAAVRLGQDEYFVLGDFRDNSLDSRMYGPVTRAAILGRATFVWLRGGNPVEPPRNCGRGL